MKLNIILAFLCINIALGLQNFPGSPIYAGSLSGSCYYDPATAPAIDPVTGRIPSGLGLNSTSDVESELVYPTNGTLVNNNLIGNITNAFNSITEPIEQLYKTLEVMKHLVKSNYAVDVLGNFAINCQLAENGTLVRVDGDPNTPGINPPPIWTYFMNGITVIMVLLTAFMLFYVITGKGFTLTS